MAIVSSVPQRLSVVTGLDPSGRLAQRFVRLLLADHLFRFVAGFAIQLDRTSASGWLRANVIWGVGMSAYLVWLQLMKRSGQTSAVAICAVVACVLLRLPTNENTLDQLITGVDVSSRLITPLLSALVVVSAPVQFCQQLEMLVARRNVRGLLYVSVLAATGALLYQVLRGEATPWVLQQLVPYLFLAALLIGNRRRTPILFVAAISILVSLKRSAYVAALVGVVAAVLTRSRAASRARTLLAIGVVVVGLVLVGRIVPVAQNAVVGRIEAGLAVVSGPSDTGVVNTYTYRTAENDEVVSRLRSSPQDLVLGISLEEFSVTEGRETLAVHNSAIALVTLGGLSYIMLFAVAVFFAARGHSPTPTLSSYVPWAIVGLVESLGGNSLLLPAFGASAGVVLVHWFARKVPTRRGLR